MPIYEYKCNKCGQINEIIVLGSADKPACKKCGSENMAKMMSAHTAPLSFRGCDAMAGGCCSAPSACGRAGGCCLE